MHTFNTPNHMTIADFPFPIHTGAIKPKWIEEAQKKGFNIVARVVDRLHIALQCKECGHLNKTRLYTLMSAKPLCENCMEQAWKADATAAGGTFIKRDPAHRHYGIYRMACGHEISRQFALIKRVAAGETGLRCEICHAAVEAAEAQVMGWDLIGSDPQGNPNYRLYKHADCGHTQRIARANMQSGRFGCGECGVDWPAAPSFIYAMHFTLENGREVVKVGFSRIPWNRLHHQLRVNAEMPSAVLQTVAVSTGQIAMSLEKRLHKALKQSHPDHIVDPACYRGQIRVISEVYDGSLTHVIIAHLNDIEARITRSVA